MAGYIGSKAVTLSTTAADVAGNAVIDGNLTVKGTTVTIDSAAVQEIRLGDNDKMTFGDATGGDLQIYHDGSASYVRDTGTGGLRLQAASDIRFVGNNTGENMLIATENSSVDLYYDNNKKLATTSTGVDITGTLTSDGMTVGGSDFANTTYTGSSVNLTGVYTGLTSDGGFAVNVRDSGYLQFSTSNTERMRIDSNGNVGIGTSLPATPLDVTKAGGGNFVAAFQNTTSATPYGVHIKDAASGANGYPLFQVTNSAGSTAHLLVHSGTGNVGIGTSSPQRSLSIGTHGTSSSAEIAFGTTTTGNASLLFGDGTTGTSLYDGYIQYQHNGGNMLFATGGGSERMRIDSSGAVAIGDSNPTRHGQTTKTLIYNGSGTTGDFALHVGRVGTGTENQVCFSNGYGKVGSITTSGTSTAYNTSSDYRLKENVTDVTDGITRVKQLAPKRFNFIVDPDTTVDGFIAHEAQTVVPEAVTGTQDAMRDEEYEVTPAVEATFDEDTGFATVKQYGQRKVISDFAPWFSAAKNGEKVAELKTIYANIKTLNNYISLPNIGTKGGMETALREFEESNPALCTPMPSEDQFYGASKGSNRLAPHIQWVFIPATKDISIEGEETKNSALTIL